MKKTILLLALSLALFSCKNEEKTTEEKAPEAKKEIAYASFGKR